MRLISENSKCGYTTIGHIFLSFTLFATHLGPLTFTFDRAIGLFFVKAILDHFKINRKIKKIVTGTLLFLKTDRGHNILYV